MTLRNEHTLAMFSSLRFILIFGSFANGMIIKVFKKKSEDEFLNDIKMKKYLVGIVMVLGILTIMAFKQIDATLDFVNKASMANRFEIAAANQALTISSNEGIKKFAQQMIDEHQTILDELAAYAKSKDLMVMDNLDDKHQGKLDSLKNETDNYDQRFKQAMVKSHEKAIKLFTDASNDKAITDSTFREWAGSKIGLLNDHLEKRKRFPMVVH